MSGQLLILNPEHTIKPNHVHVEWLFDSGERLLFRDPRRFGGIWCCPSRAALFEHRWNALGPDAATITARELHKVLAATRQSVKAALLDQTILAGVGNIYADEALFAARLHPLRRCEELNKTEAAKLGVAIRQTLRRAIKAGGSTLRDYRNTDGQPGRQQLAHAVYARSGLPCQRCGQCLQSIKITGRMTTYCPRCQPRTPV
jgi:formamidopyrimidine-DNA glycosylase